MTEYLVSKRFSKVFLGLAAATLSASCAMNRTGQPQMPNQAHLKVSDLTPVTSLPVNDHQPVPIVRDGVPQAVIYVATEERSDKLQMLVDEMVECIRLGTGAKLLVVDAMPSADKPAIIVGASSESSKFIDSTVIPVEGFRIMTAPNRVYLVGSTQGLPYPQKGMASLYHPYANNGTAWAVADFLERFVGVRWYWPIDAWGRTIVKQDSLTIPPSNYSDAPVFQMRMHHPPFSYHAPWKSRWFDNGDVPNEFKDKTEATATGASKGDDYPNMPLPQGTKELPMKPLLTFLRSDNSWPYQIRVHEPQSLWRRGGDWMAQHLELFSVTADGERDIRVFCYSSPATLKFLLDGCEEVWGKGGQRLVGASWVTTSCVTVSPADYAVKCECSKCRELWQPGDSRGSASRIMSDFLQRFCKEVQSRWPDKKVLYLPYWNYATLPEGYDFPSNLEVMLAANFPQGLPELQHPEARENTEKMLHDWSRAAGGRITTWEYSLSITGWVHAPVQFPHVAQEYYRANRNTLAGSFLNGGNVAEWSRCAPSMYCWMKVLWNPEIDIDATLDEMCRRLFGEGAKPAHELLTLMVERFEATEWPSRMGGVGKVSAPIYNAIWPPEVVAEMQELRRQAEAKLPKDAVERKRLDYWLWAFDAFVKEAQEMK